ncbi:MAG: glycosyltransferase [Bacteroidetes bacterium]|nr:glycosyltransferase [Bacteroidota bacterium]
MKKEIQSIAMLSTHGYFDPVPKLGRVDTGGQVVYVLQLAKAIAASGIKVDIFTRWFDQGQQQIDPVPGHPGVRVIRIPAGPWKFLTKEVIYDVLPELATNMIAFINHNKEYDLYHGHYVDAGVVTLDVASALKKPAFFTAHSLGAWKREQMGGDPEKMEMKFNFNYRIAQEQRIFDEVRGQTVTSILQKEKLFELYNIHRENIEVIPPGVDLKRFHPANDTDRKLFAQIPDNYIFCLSRIDTNKGHDLLLNAFDLIRKKFPGLLLVIGGGSPEPNDRELEVFETMDTIIREKGMEKQVMLIGYVPDELLVAYYQKCRFFVLPSIFEPFGMTSQEAMACAKTVVASKYGGIRNVIRHRENGMLIDPRDANEFADVMTELIRNEQLAMDMGQTANLMIQEEFGWEAIGGRFLDFYRKCC